MKYLFSKNELFMNLQKYLKISKTNNFKILVLLKMTIFPRFRKCVKSVIHFYPFSLWREISQDSEKVKKTDFAKLTFYCFFLFTEYFQRFIKSLKYGIS